MPCCQLLLVLNCMVMHCKYSWVLLHSWTMTIISEATHASQDVDCDTITAVKKDRLHRSQQVKPVHLKYKKKNTKCNISSEH